MSTKYIIDNQNGSLSGQSINGDLNVNGFLNVTSGQTTTGDSRVVGNLSATTFFGDGSNLTNIDLSQNPIDITYSELYNKLLNSGLTAGATYRLTNYKSVNYINGTDSAFNDVSSSANYAGLIDGSFNIKNGFDSTVTTIDFQKSGSFYFDGLNGNSNVLVENNNILIIGTNDFTIEWYQYLQAGNSSNPFSFSIDNGPSERSISFRQSGLSVKVYKPADPTYQFPANESEMDYLFGNSLLAASYYSSNINGVSYSSYVGSDQDDYGLEIQGFINIPNTGIYNFGLNSDDGSDAFIDGTKVSDYYGAHGNSGVANSNSYPIFLTAGTHTVKVRLQERNGGDTVTLYYKTNAIDWTIVPDSWFVLNYIFTWRNNEYPIAINKSKTDVWSHFAITRNNNNLKIFHEGEKVFERSFNDDLLSTSNLYIGNNSSLSQYTVFRGYITNFRYISGTSIYNSNFIPSEKPLYSTDDTVLLLQAKDKKSLNLNSVYNSNLVISNNLVNFDTKIPFTDFDIFVGGEFISYNEYPTQRIAKLKSDGSIDKSFLIGIDSGFDNTVNKIKLLNNGQILVGGDFSTFSGSNCYGLVKLNYDGSFNTSFSTYSSYNYFESNIKDVIVDDITGNIFIGGSFTDVGNESHNRIAKLNNNGFVDSNFNAAVDNTVFSIYLSGSSLDGQLYLGGDFTNYLGNTTYGIVKFDVVTTNKLCLNPFGVGPGFNGSITKILLDNNGLLLCGGNFTQFQGNVDAYSLIRLYSTGETFTLENNFNGINGFTIGSRIYDLDIDELDNIYVVGDFTSINGNNPRGLVRLLNDGNRDTDWKLLNDLFGGLSDLGKVVKVAPSGKLFVGGAFNNCSNYSNINSNNPKLVRIITDNISVYNSQEIYKSEEEVLLLKSISNSQLEKIAYSEKYKNDIIEYLPYNDVIGRDFEIYSGVVLPNDEYVSDFNLKWDNVENCVYFDMPLNYPVKFGNYLYFYAEFYNNSDNYYINGLAEPVLPGLNSLQYNNVDNDFPFVETRINIDSGGTKVILQDLTYNDYVNYNSNTLYVETIYKSEDSYGYVIRRVDTDRNIDVPFDFRNKKFRRYELPLNIANTTYGTDYYGFSDQFYDFLTYSNFLTTGKYRDFSVFEEQIGYNNVNCKDIKIDSLGGPNGGYWFAGNFDNNIFFGSTSLIYINGSAVRNNTFVANSNNNTIKADFLNNYINYNFSYNTFEAEFSNNIVGDSFYQNYFYDYFIYNNILSNFQYNQIFYNSYSNRIGNFCMNNSIYGIMSNNTIGNNFQTNKINRFFGSSQISAPFSFNIINYFSSNSISGVFSQNVLNGAFSSVSINGPVQYLTTNCDVTNKNFNSSTYIYNNNSKEIVSSTDNGLYISFLSGSSKVYITPVTS